MTMDTGTSLTRAAAPDDVPVILSLIHELAVYEQAAEEVVGTEDDLRTSLFGEAPVVSCLVAELDGEIVGFALWFRNFSTWLAKPGVYLEDLFVKPEVRGHGVGKSLFTELVTIARDREYGRVEWSVLDWNTDAIGFYRSLGAAPNDEWTVWRLTL
jgi:GNAT superfamily N-acetyltransferase